MSIDINHDLLCSAVNKYLDTILRIAFHHTQNNADAEDITQDVFLTLMRKAPGLNDENHLKAWLIRVAINKCKDLLKSAAKKRNTSLESAALKYSLNKEDTGVMECINKLSSLERDVVYLHYYEGLTAKEIGDIVGKKENAVFTRLKRIRVKLREMLEDDYEKI